jgi:hypothetical protein
VQRQALVHPAQPKRWREFAQHFAGDAFEHAVARADQVSSADECDVGAGAFEEALLIIEHHAFELFARVQRQRLARAHEIGGLD